MIKGPAGLDYLQKAFTERYGPPSNSSTSLPVTKSWLNLVRTDVGREWDEHLDALSTLPDTQETSSQGKAPTNLRTGGSVTLGQHSVEPSSAGMLCEREPYLFYLLIV